MKINFIAMAAAASLMLSSCAQNPETGQWDTPFGGMGTKQTIGTATGAVLGGVLGSQVGGGRGEKWAIGAGTLLGAFVGSSIGKSLDQADIAYHQQAVESAYSAPLNKSINWENPESGHSGSVTPVREGRQASTGNLCRQYKQTNHRD
jgi:surface antigen